MTETARIFFSLIVPAHADRSIFQGHVDNVCSVLDNQIPGYYEIVAVESGQDNPSDDWNHVKGEVLVIIDGDLTCAPTTLCEVITSFQDGSDMAFAGQYRDGKKTDEDPDLSYFGVRRSSLSRIHESPEGHRLILEILGPETIKKLGVTKGATSGNYILKHLSRMMGVKK